jgi:hypothetical protein
MERDRRSAMGGLIMGGLIMGGLIMGGLIMGGLIHERRKLDGLTGNGVPRGRRGL